MVGVDSGPMAIRASDVDRERVIQALREGSADGRLSYDTFLHRMDLALHARRRGELDGLLTDLMVPRRGLTGRAVRAVERVSAFTAAIHDAWTVPRLPALPLPWSEAEAFTIGRSAECDLIVDHLTVSRRHAELRRSSASWVLADLGSTNGTRCNGWRVTGGFTVRPGDQVTFGEAAFLLTGVREVPVPELPPPPHESGAAGT